MSFIFHHLLAELIGRISNELNMMNDVWLDVTGGNGIASRRSTTVHALSDTANMRLRRDGTGLSGPIMEIGLCVLFRR